MICSVSTLHRDACKAGAIPKSTTSNVRYAVGNGDACKSGTTRESTPADARYAIGNGDACKTGTIPKSKIAYAVTTCNDNGF